MESRGGLRCSKSPGAAAGGRTSEVADRREARVVDMARRHRLRNVARSTSPVTTSVVLLLRTDNRLQRVDIIGQFIKGDHVCLHSKTRA